MNMCLILDGYRDGSVWISYRFLLVAVDEERIVQKKG